MGAPSTSASGGRTGSKNSTRLHFGGRDGDCANVYRSRGCALPGEMNSSSMMGRRSNSSIMSTAFGDKQPSAKPQTAGKRLEEAERSRDRPRWTAM
jgi:hypothetical protein